MKTSYAYASGGVQYRCCLLCMLLVAGISVAAPAAEKATENSRGGITDKPQLLTQLVGKLLSLKDEIVKEEASAGETFAHMERQLETLTQEKKALEKRISEEEARSAEESSERERLTKSITEKERILVTLAKAVEEGEGRLEKTAASIPPSRNNRLKQSAAAADESPDSVPDRLNAVFLAANDIAREQATIIASKATVDVPDRGRVEADVLWIGTALGYYATPDDKHAGILVFRGDRWSSEPDDLAASAIRKAIRLARKDEPAALVELPILPPQQKGDAE